MCGLIGEVGKKIGDKSSFLALRQLMHQRGPDMDGYFSDEATYRFGFKRLAILDLSEAGNQPMRSDDGQWIILMNGEVYNYRELHQALGNPPLRSGADTEVVLAWLMKKGFEAGIKDLNGMFAISLYHIPSEKLYLARDFAGIKPLFYGIQNNTLVYASQFNQIFKHELFAKNLTIRSEVMREYMAFGYQHAPNTVFEHLFQLRPGEYLVWDNKAGVVESQQRYYTWDDQHTIPETQTDLSSKTNQVIASVVKSQLHADVPVATFLSGGIDSPLITAHAVKQYERISAFTVQVEDEKINEAEIAKRYAQHIGVKQIIEKFTEKELLHVIEEHFQGIPEPIGDYSTIPTYLITKRARQFATVMLSGDGGDELFWGYPRFLSLVEQLPWLKWPLSIRRFWIPFLKRFNKQISYTLSDVRDLGEMNMRKHTQNRETHSLFPGVPFSSELMADYASSTTDPEEALLYLRKNEFYAHMQRVLRKVDLMSMANSLEVRVPFLDANTLAFCTQLKPELGIKHHNPKLLLKKSLSEFIPQNLIEQQKRGFSVPIEAWMRGPLKQDILYHLTQLPFFGAKNINMELLHKQVHDFYEQKHKTSWAIWHLYAWQKWAKANNLI